MSLGKVFVAGHKGMVGSSIIRELTQENLCSEIITIDKLKVNFTWEDCCQKALDELQLEDLFGLLRPKNDHRIQKWNKEF